MLNKRNSNSYLILGIALVFFGTALVLHSQFSKPKIEIAKQESAININQDFLGILAIGNRRLISDLIWIQTLLESDDTHYSGKDLNNWMYLRFKTISILDPKFYENYLFGGIYLSIVKDDLEGAADIFEKGLTFYPKDFRLNYHAGFNYYFEMGDFKKGLEKLEVVENDPKAPGPLKYIINKLRFETSNNYEATLNFLVQSYEMNKDPAIRRKLSRDIYSLKAEMDLKCLNEGKANCSMKDAEGEKYIYKDGKWKSQKEFLPYRIFRK